MNTIRFILYCLLHQPTLNNLPDRNLPARDSALSNTVQRSINTPFFLLLTSHRNNRRSETATPQFLFTFCFDHSGDQNISAEKLPTKLYRPLFIHQCCPSPYSQK